MRHVRARNTDKVIYFVTGGHVNSDFIEVFFVKQDNILFIVINVRLFNFIQVYIDTGVNLIIP